MRALTTLTVGVLIVACGCNTASESKPKPAASNAPAPTAPVSADTATEKDYQKLEGTWKYESFVLDGIKTPEDLISGHQYVFRGKQFTRTDAGGQTKGTFTIDPAKKPMTIDLTDTEGLGKDVPLLGIYELDGDTLKLCVALAAENRPKEFASPSKGGLGFIVLRREKP